ncbi:MAG: nickel pincer cofactor biosynthesis protein LarB [Thermoplasmata archaeon]|nr:nickel pincer cofactor biosynthesis protein LarB [Candidatus Sysuiplasma jiujiangense]
MKKNRYLNDYTLAIGKAVKYDISRFYRKGFPEIVFSSGKSVRQLTEICIRVVESGEPVIVSKIGKSRSAAVTRAVLKRIPPGIKPKYWGDAEILSIVPLKWKSSFSDLPLKAAIVTGGSSDIRVAAETEAILEILQCKHDSFFDCGIAGLHRTVEVAAELQRGDYAVAIVFAGMEGALASVITSLVDIPVIGVPVSTGYGFGGSGIAAITSMLQSCIPGLTVVNIDNGVGAAASAVAIMNLFAGRPKRRPGSDINETAQA